MTLITVCEWRCCGTKLNRSVPVCHYRDDIIPLQHLACAWTLTCTHTHTHTHKYHLRLLTSQVSPPTYPRCHGSILVWPAAISMCTRTCLCWCVWSTSSDNAQRSAEERAIKIKTKPPHPSLGQCQCWGVRGPLMAISQQIHHIFILFTLWTPHHMMTHSSLASQCVCMISCVSTCVQNR